MKYLRLSLNTGEAAVFVCYYSLSQRQSIIESVSQMLKVFGETYGLGVSLIDEDTTEVEPGAQVFNASGNRDLIVREMAQLAHRYWHELAEPQNV